MQRCDVSELELHSVREANVNRTLPSWVARVGLFVKADFLALTQLLELCVHDCGTVEEHIVPLLSRRGNEPKPLVVADGNNRTCRHR